MHLVCMWGGHLKPMSPLEGAMNVSRCFPSTSTGFISTSCNTADIKLEAKEQQLSHDNVTGGLY